MKVSMILFLSVILFSCVNASESTSIELQQNKKVPADSLENAQVAYFASGCFWCLEAIYQTVDGVLEAESGYSGGTKKNPTYEQVCTGTTGHAEAVKVYYDSSMVSYTELVDVFFNSHDPTTKNQQGPDSGTQYRSAIFYSNDQEKMIAEKAVQDLLDSERFPIITTEISAFDKFYKAEEYHQDYVRKNQEKSYVKNVSMPRIKEFFENMPKYNKNKP